MLKNGLFGFTKDKFSRFTGILPVHKSLIENGAISKIGGVAIEAKVGVQSGVKVGVQSMEWFQPEVMEGQRCFVKFS